MDLVEYVEEKLKDCSKEEREEKINQIIEHFSKEGEKENEK